MKKEFHLMSFKKFTKHKINESVKEKLLDKILDKISNGIKLTENEKEFLDNYSEKTDDDVMDYKMLSSETTFDKISKLLDMNKKIICNLHDNSGKIGSQIISIENNYQKEVIVLILKNEEKVVLKDNKLYSLVYDFDNDEYSLESDGEFYEQIPIKK